VGMMFTQLGFIGHDLGHNQVFGARRRNHLLGLIVATDLGYREESFVASFRQIVHHLSDAGAAVSRPG